MGAARWFVETFMWFWTVRAVEGLTPKQKEQVRMALVPYVLFGNLLGVLGGALAYTPIAYCNVRDAMELHKRLEQLPKPGKQAVAHAKPYYREQKKQTKVNAKSPRTAKAGG